MKTVDFIQQSDFPLLIPYIEKFAKETDTPFHQHINEVSASLMNDNVITIIGKDDEREGGIVAYLCGFYLNKTEFMVTQMYSHDPKLTKVIGHFLDDHLRSVGIKRIVILFKHNPRTAERLGFKVERYVMVKTLESETKNE
jgi:hypothetical protein